MSWIFCISSFFFPFFFFFWSVALDLFQRSATGYLISWKLSTTCPVIDKLLRGNLFGFWKLGNFFQDETYLLKSYSFKNRLKKNWAISMSKNQGLVVKYPHSIRYWPCWFSLLVLGCVSSFPFSSSNKKVW